MTEYQQPDPRARWIAVLVVLVATIVCLPAILWLQGSQAELQSWLEANIHLVLAQPLWGLVAGLVLILPVVGLVTYLLILAKRIIRAQRFPPPGLAVTRRTAVLEGDRAVRRGRLLQLGAGLLLLVASGIPIVLWRMAVMLAGVADS